MRIGELARRTGATASRIRFYEDKKLLPAARRDSNGYRNYADSAVATLQFVDQAQRLGFSLSEIRAPLSATSHAVPSAAMIVKALLLRQEQIDQDIADANAKKRAIAVLLEELRCVAKDSARN